MEFTTGPERDGGRDYVISGTSNPLPSPCCVCNPDPPINLLFTLTKRYLVNMMAHFHEVAPFERQTVS